MQAPESLTPIQKDAIEKAYTHLSVLVVFCESVQSKLQEPDDRLLAKVNEDSARICLRLLLTAFPHLHELRLGGGE